jgi:putative ABC transport system permease protein
MFGIAWGIVSITLMVAAGEGLRVGQERVAEGFGKYIMIVNAGRTSLQAGGMRAGRQIRWRYQDAPLLAQEATACEHVVPEIGRGSSTVESLYNNASLNVVGSIPPFADIRTIPVDEGRFYNWEDVEQGRRVAFLGSDAKKQLFASRPILGESVSIRGIPYTIIGVMPFKDQDSSYDGRDIQKVFVPITAALRDFPKNPPAQPDEIDRFIASPKSLAVHETCKAQVRRTLGRIYNFDPRDEEAAGIWDTVESAKAFATMTDGMKYFLGAVGLTTLFLGGLGVMNVMLVAVRERTREIGVRKAVGATSRAIVRQFFLETLIIVALSGGLGMAGAYGLCLLVNQLPMPQYFAGLLPTWEAGTLTLVLLGTVAILAAVYPARRAAAVDPIEALRQEAGG